MRLLFQPGPAGAHTWTNGFTFSTPGKRRLPKYPRCSRYERKRDHGSLSISAAKKTIKKAVLSCLSPVTSRRCNGFVKPLDTHASRTLNNLCGGEFVSNGPRPVPFCCALHDRALGTWISVFGNAYEFRKSDITGSAIHQVELGTDGRNISVLVVSVAADCLED